MAGENWARLPSEEPSAAESLLTRRAVPRVVRPWSDVTIMTSWPAAALVYAMYSRPWYGLNEPSVLSEASDGVGATPRSGLWTKAAPPRTAAVCQGSVWALAASMARMPVAARTSAAGAVRLPVEGVVQPVPGWGGGGLVPPE